MVVNVDTEDTLIAQRITITANAARVFEFTQEVLVENPIAALDELVTYTDPDLDEIFYGQVTSIDFNYKNGEGIKYKATDLFRLICKDAAVVSAGTGETSLICFEDGFDLQTAVETLLDPYFTPSEIDYGLGSIQIPGTSKAGATVDNWLDDILRYAGYCVTFIRHSITNPNEFVVRLYNDPSLTAITLTEGNYAASVSPTATSPLFLGGNVKKSLNKRYSRIIGEGAGEFTRRGQFAKTAPLPVTPDTYVAIPIGDWTITHPYLGDPTVALIEIDTGDIGVSRAYFNTDTNGRPIGCNQTGGLQFQVTVNNVPGIPTFTFTVDDINNNIFIRRGVVSFTISSASFGTLSKNAAQGIWTGYTNPMRYINNAGGNLGDKVFIFNEYFIYTDSLMGITQDYSTELGDRIDALAPTYQSDEMEEANIDVHIKGLNEYELGQPITNFNNLRIQQISYDLVNRTTRLKLSNNAVPENITLAKLTRDQIITRDGKNAIKNEVTPFLGCFSGETYYSDGQ